MTKFGWYSAKAAKRNPLRIYLTPAGEKLGVTRVSDSMDSRSGWDDERCIGVVDKYVCSYKATRDFNQPEFVLHPPQLSGCGITWNGFDLGSRNRRL